MKIQIYGTGCPKCEKLAETVQAAVARSGIDAEIEKVTSIDAITNAGVMMTPAIGIDGKIICSGRIPSSDEIAGWLGGTPTCSCGKEEGAATGNPAKKIVTVLLLLLVVVGLAAVVFRAVKQPETDGAKTEFPISDNAVVVYYFHGNKRCATCNKIETLTRRAVEEKFAPQLADGRVVMRSVNIEEPENEHFATDFGLASRCVVMQKAGAYKTFDQIFEFIRDPEKFTAYIQDGVAGMLTDTWTD